MDLSLKNKNALVLGGSAGIGKAIAKGLYFQGANVMIASRSTEKLDLATREIGNGDNTRIRSKVCDVSSPEDLKELFDEFKRSYGTVDILINNQGGPVPGSFEKIDESKLLEALNTNLLSFYRSIKLCIDDMKLRKWGRIINILSVSAKEPIPNMLLSNMIRPAVLGMSKTIAQEYAAFGITCNSVLPNAVLTERTRFFIEERVKNEGVSFEQALKDIAINLPIKYIATPEEFAQAVLFLCSVQATYVNGIALPIDGGASKGLY